MNHCAVHASSSFLHIAMIHSKTKQRIGFQKIAQLSVIDNVIFCFFMQRKRKFLQERIFSPYMSVINIFGENPFFFSFLTECY